MTSKKKVYLIVIIFITTELLISESYSLGDIENLRTSQSEIFDGMYANYTFEIFITSYREANSIFRYRREWGSIFNVTWRIDGNGTYTWHENIQTRLTSNASSGWSFGNNVHSPIWLFTNHSIGDLVLIAVDLHGDHIFNITRDLTYRHPIYGNMEIWVLQDIVFPQSLAWYEKSKGLLINGTFVYTMGWYHYNLTLTESNLFLQYQGTGGQIPPFYILFIILIITAIIIFVILRKKKALH
jgi:hypothetical protein